MKTIFVVLPFGTEKYIEIARKVAHKVELLLDTYVEVVSDAISPVSLKREDITPIEYLFQSLGCMLRAGVVVFASDWKGDRECSLLHAIALAYGLDILEMNESAGKPLKGSESINSCPFCKSAEVSMCKVSKGEGYTMHCSDCGANGSVEDTEQEAVDAWNNVEAQHV